MRDDGDIVKVLLTAIAVTAGAIALAAAAALAWPAPAHAADPRVCGPAPRASDGTIKRSRAVLREFRALYPCPSTGKTTGACPGWALDHTVPLVCGGCDAVGNLQWLPVQIKSASGTLPKDRWERSVYCQRSSR